MSRNLPRRIGESGPPDLHHNTEQSDKRFFTSLQPIIEKALFNLVVKNFTQNKGNTPDLRNTLPADVIVISLFERIVHEHIEMNLGNTAFGIVGDDIERPIDALHHGNHG